MPPVMVQDKMGQLLTIIAVKKLITRVKRELVVVFCSFRDNDLCGGNQAFLKTRNARYISCYGISSEFSFKIKLANYRLFAIKKLIT